MRRLTNQRCWEFAQDLVVYAIRPETTYIVRTGSRALVIDPNLAALRILEGFLRLGKFECVDALLTHPHPDHFDGALTIQERHGGRVLAHQSLIDLQQEIGPMSAHQLEDRFPSLLPLYGQFLCWWSVEYQKLNLSALEDEEIPGWPLKVLQSENIRYHSPCDCVIYGDGFAFTGDLVFVRNSQFGFGRTDLPGGDDENLTDGLGALVDLLRKQCGLRRDAMLFPGHGEAFTFAELIIAINHWIDEVPCGDD